MAERVLPGLWALTWRVDSPWGPWRCALRSTGRRGLVFGAESVSRAGVGWGLTRHAPSPLQCDTFEVLAPFLEGLSM